MALCIVLTRYIDYEPMTSFLRTDLESMASMLGDVTV